MNTAPIVSKVWRFCTIPIPSFFNDLQNSHYSGGASRLSPFLERTTHPGVFKCIIPSKEGIKKEV